MNPEQYLCGAILISGEAVMNAIQGIVTADCFQLEAYKAIFTAALSLMENGAPVDPVLHGIANDPEAADTSRIAASRGVLEYGLRLIETTDIMKRLEALEGELEKQK